jgi:GT2 family glycosyltransferase
MLTRASAWETIGGLDERLFLYCDDLHYCRSLQKIGLVSVHMPALAYTHFVGFSLQRLPYLYAGLRWFYTKFSGRTRCWLADVVMKAGLYLRLAVYGALALFTREGKYKDRRNSMRRVLDLWGQTAVPGIRFH